MLTGSLAIWLLWSVVGLLTGLSARCFWFLERASLGQEEEGFLARVVGPFFLGVTGLFVLITFTVGDAAVVTGFLAVVEEGARVVRRPALDGTEWRTGVVRGTLRVQWLYGVTRGVLVVVEG